MTKKTKLQRQAERLIARHGSIRKAALYMGITHSTLLRYRSGVIKTVTEFKQKFLDVEVGK